jgi:hypothetical protein
MVLVLNLCMISTQITFARNMVLVINKPTNDVTRVANGDETQSFGCSQMGVIPPLWYVHTCNHSTDQYKEWFTFVICGRLQSRSLLPIRQQHALWVMIRARTKQFGRS